MCGKKQTNKKTHTHNRTDIQQMGWGVELCASLKIEKVVVKFSVFKFNN